MSMDVDLVKEAIREVLAERTTIPPEKHQAHHQTFDEFLPELRDFLAYRRVRMAQLKRRDDLWLKVRDSAVGAVVISCVIGILGALGWVGHLVIQAGIHAIQHGSGSGP